MKKMETRIKAFKKWLKKEKLDKQIIVAVHLNQWIFWCSLADLPLFTLEWYARVLGVTPAYVSRCYSQYYQRSFQQVLNQRKMMEARKLLREVPRLTIDDIAQKVGYCTGNYFIKVFKKECRITPYQYRKQLRVVSHIPINLWSLVTKLQDDINDFINEGTKGRFQQAVTIHGGTKTAPKKKKRKTSKR
jgi:AraC-like DNA-binding protein